MKSYSILGTIRYTIKSNLHLASLMRMATVSKASCGVGNDFRGLVGALKIPGVWAHRI